MLTSTLPRHVNDAEPGFVLNLCAALQQTFDITLLAPMGAGAVPEETLNGVSIRRYRYAPLRRWETLAYPGGIMPRLRQQPWRWLQVPLLIIGLLLAIRRLHAEQPVDLIHAHWLVPQGLAALLALPGKCRPPLVVTSHGGDLHTLAHTRLAFLLRWVLARCDGLTIVSQRLATEARRLQPQPMANTAIIPMGVSLATFADKPYARPAEMQHPADLRLLFVGRLVEKKGIRYLIDACADPLLTQRSLRLYIAGDGPLDDVLRAQVRQRGLEQRVHFLGAQASAKIPALMAAADAVVVPSVEAADGDCDGLPTVMLEAMAARRLVIGTPVGGIPQVLRDGVTGRLVPPRDAHALARAIHDAMADPLTREPMIERAYQQVRQYDWSLIAARYAQVLTQALPAHA